MDTDNGLASGCESKTHQRSLRGHCAKPTWPSPKFGAMTHCRERPARSSGKMHFSSVCSSAIFPTTNIGRRASKRRCATCRLVTSVFYDLKRDPVALLDKPYHSLFFYLPRAALNAIADDVAAPRIGDLNYKPGAGVNDATIFSLGSAILPALSHADQANRLFVDHVTLAVGIHLAQTYGGLQPVARPVRGGLAPWQERRAKEVLSSNLDGSVPLKEVARECRLSVSHFSRAFRRTMGVAPHHWLLMRRVEVAKEKLRNSRLPLAEVALACGFADQSHLTRVFTWMVGVSPGAWRRALDGQQADGA